MDLGYGMRFILYFAIFNSIQEYADLMKHLFLKRIFEENFIFNSFLYPDLFLGGLLAFMMALLLTEANGRECGVHCLLVCAKSKENPDKPPTLYL